MMFKYSVLFICDLFGYCQLQVFCHIRDSCFSFSTLLVNVNGVELK